MTNNLRMCRWLAAPKLLVLVLGLPCGPAGAQAVLKIDRLPANTPVADTVFVAGSFNGWNPRGARYALRRNPDGTRQLRLPPGLGAVEYKFTRGSWATVEIGENNQGIANRKADLGPAREVVHQVLAWDDLSGTPAAPKKSTASPQVHVLGADFEMPQLGRRRRVLVYLPVDYAARPTRRYPVLYLHDGQNLFDAATSFAGTPWGCDEVAEQAARAGRAAPVILVGVANSPDRISEYGPRRCGTGRAGDLSRQYGRFLVEEVKPFVDRTYATLPGAVNAGVGGSSLGGLISLHLAKWYPTVFGRCAAVSPSLWWDQEYFLRNLHVNPAWLAGCRVWLDMGDKEGLTRATQQAGVRRARRLAALLGKSGLAPGREFTYREVPGGEHSEWHWGQRFGEVLAFLFPACG